MRGNYFLLLQIEVLAVPIEISEMRSLERAVHSLTASLPSIAL